MTAAERIRAKLIDLAIRGKLVPQNANDEPAEVLLSKIREEKARLLNAKKIRKEKPLRPITDEEKSFDLPRGWTWCRLGEFCTQFQYGTARKSASVGDVPVLRMGNLREGEIDYTDLVFTSDKDDIRQYSLNNGDLLFNRTNSSEKVGKVAIFRGNKPCIFAGYLVRFKPILCSPEYINYLMNSYYQRDFCQSVKSDAVNQSNISASKFILFPVPLPPLAEQKRIVAKLEELLKAADILGECAQKFDELSDKARAKILDIAIRGKLVPQDVNDEPADVLLSKIRGERERLLKEKKIKKEKPLPPITDEEKPFDLPNGWTWCRLSELGQFTGGHTPSTSIPKFWGGDVIWVTSKDMKSKYIADSILKLTKLGAAELSQVPAESILMCTRSGILKRTFPVAIAKKKLTINQDQRALTLYLPEMAEYLYSVLKSNESKILTNYTKEGTTVSSIDWDKFVDFPIPLPPLAEQKRIVAKVEAMLAACEKLRNN